jgi:glycosyltransferase involved in cell wall biosynthesis
MHAYPHATILASKPLLRSYGLALAIRDGPVVLDIDDPEIELATADARTTARALLGLENPLITRALMGARGRGDGITVANAVLKSRYGGVVIPHARDETWFDEEVRSRSRARQVLELDSEMRLVTFVGTVRNHKGLDDLLEAHRSLPVSTLAVVGSGSDSQPEARVIRVPPVDYTTAMRWVAAADVVVVPQRDTRIGRLQSPAKLVDALAIGRAIVASDLPPIVETVADAAKIVPANSPESLARAVSTLLDNRDEREALEGMARARFLSALSVESVRPRMMRLIREAELSHG